MARTVRSAKLDSRSARVKVPAGKSVHWVAIDRGRALGYRKGAKGGVWIAKLVRRGLRREATLGSADDVLDADGDSILTFSQAQECARAWLARTDAEAAGSPTAITVAEACRRYVEYLRAEAKTAKDAEWRLNRHVTPSLGHRLVSELTLIELERWRNGLIRHDADPEIVDRSKDTANRLLAYLKAALNRLMRDPRSGVTDDRAWRWLRPFPAVGRARQVHLDHDQLRRLISVTSGGLRRLIIAGALSGCRYGELRIVKVRNFHGMTGTLHVPGGKTGERDVILSAEGARFFGKLVADRHPDQLLLVHDNGTPWGVKNLGGPMAKAVRAAQLPSDTVFYSLRHTYASRCLTPPGA